MKKYFCYYSQLMLLLYSAIILDSVWSQSCEDEILRVSNAGKIEASSDTVVVGQTATITCSTDCAYYWHTILVDGEVFTDNNMEREGFVLNVTKTILNCPDCTRPSDVDCSDQQQGPVQTILNFTLLSYGDHYVQCYAHMFNPNSDLWPSNRIISIPSKMLKIEGVKIEEETTSMAASIVTTPSSTSHTSSTSSTNDVVTANSSHSSYFTNITFDLSSNTINKPPRPTNIHQTSTTLILNTVSSSTTALPTTKDHVPSRTATSSVRIAVTTQTTELHSLPTSQLPTFTDLVIDAGPVDQQVSRSTCDQFTMNSTTTFVIFGVLSFICVMLIIAIIILLVINRRSAAQYNQLSLTLPSTNLYQLNSNKTNSKAELDSTSPTPRHSLTT